MSRPSSSATSHTTLALCAILHAFTHAYGTMLVPMYLLVRDDLQLPGVKAVGLIVSLYGAVYFLLSYPAGILADRVNRKTLLGLGLIGNAFVIALMGLTHQYWALLALGVVAGIFGSLFHPAANSLVPNHYPKSPGMALGMLAIGSGIGFFFGPQYAGWRAETVTRPWLNVSPWQIPCVEMGILGLAVGLLFLVLAKEAPHTPGHQRGGRMPLGQGLRRKVLAIAMLLGCRDFAGSSSISLLSIYFQKAHNYDAKQTGFVIGVIGLVSIVATPLGIWLTSGRRRLPGLAVSIILGGLILASVPHWPLAWLLPVLILFQICHLGSYAMSEVAMVERTTPTVRGRVVGLYLTLAGTLGAIAPWVVGFCTDALGDNASRASAYIPLFTFMGALMVFASIGVRLVSRLGPITHPSAEPELVAVEPGV